METEKSKLEVVLDALKKALDAYESAQISEFAGTGWTAQEDPVLIEGRKIYNQMRGDLENV
jgi:hypothetical protein